MTITIKLPHDFDRWQIAARLRWWATAYARLSEPNLRIIADLEEAATEIDLVKLALSD